MGLRAFLRGTRDEQRSLSASENELPLIVGHASSSITPLQALVIADVWAAVRVLAVQPRACRSTSIARPPTAGASPSPAGFSTCSTGRRQEQAKRPDLDRSSCESRQRVVDARRQPHADPVRDQRPGREGIDKLPEAKDRALWATALYAGLRRGERRALHRKDVDLAGGVIRVERGWDDGEGEVPPKSKQGRRKVPIRAVLRDRLLEYLIDGPTSGRIFVGARSYARGREAARAAKVDDRRGTSAGMAMRR
jgi:hypothetical protein